MARLMLLNWLNRLKPAEAAVLGYLIEIYPSTARRAAIAEYTGYSANSGGFNQACAKLNTLDLVAVQNGEMQAAQELFA